MSGYRNSQESDSQEEILNSRYREICIYLWRMIHNYVNVSMDNIALTVRLFEKAVEMTDEVAYLETEPTSSHFLQRIILDDVPDIRQHIEELTLAVLNTDNPGRFHEPAHGPAPDVAVWTAASTVATQTAHGYSGNTETAVAAWTATNTSTAPEPAQRKNAEESRDDDRKRAIQAAKRKPLQGGLDAVSGLTEAKQLIREAVILPIKFPNLFTGGSCPWTSVLLYGPPGTGKTRLAHAVASEANAQFYAITSADLLSSWIGESEKLIRELFRTVNGGTERVVLFVDEIDGICRKRTSQEADHTRRTKTELMIQMEGLKSHVFLLAATNCPWDLDPAFVRRFQRRVFIPLPESEARLSIIRKTIQNSETNLSAAEWETLSELTDGYSGSDLTDLSKAALMQPIKQLDGATHWLIGHGGMMTPASATNPLAIKQSLYNLASSKVTRRVVNLDDFTLAVASTPKSVSTDDIKHYQLFNKKYA